MDLSMDIIHIHGKPAFCIKFCTFIGNLYPHMSTDFRLFIFTFNEMALILLRAPIIFTVSSFDCSATWFKLRIQTFWEQGRGAKAIISTYPDHKGWKLSFVKKVCCRVDSTGQ